MPVTIVMPNLNNGNTIAQSIASVIDDPIVAEIIVYDNGSIDASPVIAESFGDKVRVIRGERNIGATRGRHEAVLQAATDHICYLDGDDTLSPGAVSLAFRALQDQCLDIALFDLINVDKEGANAVPFILPPREPFDGKTACALTLGGWRMHIWGVMSKRLYLEAWDGFSHYGYSDDELLTRSILARAERIAGCDGKFFYRFVPKPDTPFRVLGINRTAVRTLKLGIDAGLDPGAIDRQHEMVVRFLVGLVRRGLMGLSSQPDVAAIVDEYRALLVPPPPSLKGRARLLILSLARPLLG